MARPKKPVVPADSIAEADDLWANLYRAAHGLYTLSPWRWMTDSDTFGVLDPETEEVGWSCVLGAAGELEGLVLYLGDSGFDTLRRILKGEIIEDEGAFGQDALSLVFGSSAELSTGEKRRIRSSGVVFRGRRAWPKLESHGDGRLPRQPYQDEIARMYAALVQVMEVCARAERDRSLLLPDEEGRLLIRERSPTNNTWIDTRRESPRPISFVLPTVDQARAERLRRTLPVTTQVWECDVFPGAGAIAERGQDPFVPPVFMIADVESGFIHGLELGGPKGRLRWAQERLIKIIEGARVRPTRLRLQRPTLIGALTPIAESLGIKVEQVGSLPAIADARPGLDAVMSRNPKRRR